MTATFSYKGLLYSKLKPEEKRFLCESVGFCELCGATDCRLVLDHDHETGLVRCVACGPCNLKLGWVDAFKLEWLDAAARILDDPTGASRREKLADILLSRYRQRNAEWVEEVRSLQQKQAELHSQMDKNNERLEALKARFEYRRFTA